MVLKLAVSFPWYPLFQHASCSMSTHYWKEETRPMIRHMVKPLTMAVAVVALVSSLAQAAPDEMKKTSTPVAPPASMSGTVTAVDTHGTATRRTAEGKTHKLKHHI